LEEGSSGRHWDWALDYVEQLVELGDESAPAVEGFFGALVSATVAEEARKILWGFEQVQSWLRRRRRQRGHPGFRLSSLPSVPAVPNLLSGVNVVRRAASTIQQ
jgi:hypothetical protein